MDAVDTVQETLWPTNSLQHRRGESPRERDGLVKAACVGHSGSLWEGRINAKGSRNLVCRMGLSILGWLGRGLLGGSGQRRGQGHCACDTNANRTATQGTQILLICL